MYNMYKIADLGYADVSMLYAGWREGRLPNMTDGHVFVREPVNRVPGLQYSIRHILFILHSQQLTVRK
jgi:hypothetical protein